MADGPISNQDYDIISLVYHAAQGAETLRKYISNEKPVHKEEFKNANAPVTGTFSRPFAMLSGTAAGRVRSSPSAGWAPRRW